MEGPSLGETLVDGWRLRNRVQELAHRVGLYAASEDQPLVVVGILNGSLMFLAELIRAVKRPVQLEWLRLSSYQHTSPLNLRCVLDLPEDLDLKDRKVLIVDDVLDTGATLAAACELVADYHPRVVKVLVLLRKAGKAQQQVALLDVGFDIPDVFVVGYGMDYNQEYRWLTHITELKVGGG